MWRTWGDARLPVLVLDNGDLNEVTWEQREMEGDAMFPASREVTSLPYAEYAQLPGLHGTVMDSPEGVVPAWEAALSSDRPFLIHAVVDPAVPLLPPRLEPSLKEKLLPGFEQEGTELAARPAH